MVWAAHVAIGLARLVAVFGSNCALLLRGRRLWLAFGNLPVFPAKAHTQGGMPYAPQSQFRQRAERIGFEERTPVVVRFPEGNRCSGQLQVVSITGGLLCLRRPMQPGSVGKLMFLTHKGCVLGEAQMLSPVSWDQQPFKFTAFHDDDRYRLQTVIQLRLAKSRRQNALRSWEREQMERFRAW